MQLVFGEESLQIDSQV